VHLRVKSIPEVHGNAARFHPERSRHRRRCRAQPKLQTCTKPSILANYPDAPLPTMASIKCAAT
jgi:hypothetical protein